MGGFVVIAFISFYEGVQSEHPGRESKMILQPDDLFLENINDYLYNRFLNIGRNIIYHTALIIFYLNILKGEYPNFLWLFKEYLPTLKETMQFQGM